MDDFMSIGKTIGYFVLINKNYRRVYLEDDRIKYTIKHMCFLKKEISVYKKDIQKTIRVGTHVGLILHEDDQSIMIQCPNEDLAIGFESFFTSFF